MKQTKNHTKNITTIDTLKNISIINILKNFPCTLISGVSSLIIHILITYFSNYRNPLTNIIDSLTLYMWILSSIDEVLLYLFKDESKLTDALRLKFKLIILIVMAVYLLLITGIGIYMNI